MTFIHKGHRLLINDLSIQEYGKSVEQMLKEIENAVAKEEQLLTQQKAKEEQLLTQQKAKEEQLIVNMHQNLHINTQTIATICNIPLELVQQVLTQKGLI